MIGKFLILFFTTGESSIPFAMIPFAIKILNLSSFIIAEVLFSLPSSIKKSNLYLFRNDFFSCFIEFTLCQFFIVARNYNREREDCTLKFSEFLNITMSFKKI